MNSKRIGKFRQALVVLALAPLALTAACGSGDGDSGSGDSNTIVIGGSFSLTGANSSYDEPLAQGLELVVDEVNDAGGVEIGGETYTFELKIEDAKSEPSVAVAGAKKLVTQEGAKIVFGNGTSDTGAAVAQYMMQSKTLYFGVFTTLETLLGTDGADLLFRMWPSANATNESYIPAAVEALGIEGGVSAVFPNEDVSNSIIEGAEPIFDEAGAPVSDQQLFQTGTTDFAPILDKISSSVGGLYIGYSQTDLENLIRQAVTNDNVPLNFITYGGSSEPGLNHKDDIGGYTWQYFTRAIEDSEVPEVKQWTDSFMEATDKTEVTSLDSWGLAFYDPFKALVAAMEVAGSTDDVNAIADELHGACYEGIRVVCWDEDGRASASYDMGVIKDGTVSIETVPVDLPDDAKNLS